MTNDESSASIDDMDKKQGSKFSFLRILILLFLSLTTIFLFYAFGRPIWTPLYLTLIGEETVGSVLNEIEPQSNDYWIPLFTSAGVTYPPDTVTFLAFKEEGLFEIWAANRKTDPTHIVTIPITSRSGTIGPKRREFDLQVPEGIYDITGLNPNSRFHLSMKVDYPNEWDKQHASDEDVDRMGGDIFVHGGGASIGCIALGNENIEKVFTLVAKTGSKNTQIIIAPLDLRVESQDRKLPAEEEWYSELYAQISEEIKQFPGRAK